MSRFSHLLAASAGDCTHGPVRVLPGEGWDIGRVFPGQRVLPLHARVLRLEQQLGGEEGR